MDDAELRAEGGGELSRPMANENGLGSQVNCEEDASIMPHVIPSGSAREGRWRPPVQATSWAAGCLDAGQPERRMRRGSK